MKTGKNTIQHAETLSNLYLRRIKMNEGGLNKASKS